MTKEELFIEALKSNINPADSDFPTVLPAVVIEVGETFCKVKLTHNDLEIEEVRYSATEDNNTGFVLVPAGKSKVLVSSISGDENNLHLLAIDEIEKVKLKIKEEQLTIDKSGFDLTLDGGKIQLKNSNSNLKELLNTMIDMITQLTVSTGVGPSGTPLPPTIKKANELKNNVKSLFK